MLPEPRLGNEQRGYGFGGRVEYLLEPGRRDPSTATPLSQFVLDYFSALTFVGRVPGLPADVHRFAGPPSRRACAARGWRGFAVIEAEGGDELWVSADCEEWQLFEDREPTTLASSATSLDQ
jgi:hypothetical protein